MKYKGVKAFMGGIRPCVIALILTTASIMLLNNLFGLTTLGGGFSPDLRGIAILAILCGIAFFAKKVIKKKQ
jgi:chromate transporter